MYEKLLRRPTDVIITKQISDDEYQRDRAPLIANIHNKHPNQAAAAFLQISKHLPIAKSVLRTHFLLVNIVLIFPKVHQLQATHVLFSKLKAILAKTSNANNNKRFLFDSITIWVQDWIQNKPAAINIFNFSQLCLCHHGTFSKLKWDQGQSKDESQLWLCTIEAVLKLEYLFITYT